MKKLTYLFLALIIFACSSDDSSDGNQLFLEKYDGVVWENDGDFDFKIAFDNNTQSYIEEYGGTCYVEPLQGSYQVGSQGYVFLIEEETENSLTRKTTALATDTGGEYIYTAEYSVDGNTLTLVYSYGDIYVFTRTDDVPCE